MSRDFVDRKDRLDYDGYHYKKKKSLSIPPPSYFKNRAAEQFRR